MQLLTMLQVIFDATNIYSDLAVSSTDVSEDQVPLQEVNTGHSICHLCDDFGHNHGNMLADKHATGQDKE